MLETFFSFIHRQNFIEAVTDFQSCIMIYSEAHIIESCNSIGNTDNLGMMQDLLLIWRYLELLVVL